jgi:hypothetical protein
MVLHSHLHCIVPNDGLTKNGQWPFPKRGNGNFHFPLLAMNKVFKAIFMKGLKKLIKDQVLSLPNEIQIDSRILKKLVNKISNKDWVEYTKKPFAGVNHVVSYLDRYSHRVAITNPRIISIDDQTVSFTYKDYNDGVKKKLMQLKGEEFIRRFCLHMLPPRFRKVRQYGFTSNASKKKSINKARITLGQRIVILLNRKERKQKAIQRIFDSPNQCPCCKKWKDENH